MFTLRMLTLVSDLPLYFCIVLTCLFNGRSRPRLLIRFSLFRKLSKCLAKGSTGRLVCHEMTAHISQGGEGGAYAIS